MDAFMANLEKDAKKQGLKKVNTIKCSPTLSAGLMLLPILQSQGNAEDEKPKKGVRDDIEEADDEESYYKWLEENPNAGRGEQLLSVFEEFSF